MLESIKANGDYTIKQILKDGWDDFYDLNKNNIRDVVVENVKKVGSSRKKYGRQLNLFALAGF